MKTLKETFTEMIALPGIDKIVGISGNYLRQIRFDIKNKRGLTDKRMRALIEKSGLYLRTSEEKYTLKENST